MTLTVYLDVDGVLSSLPDSGPSLTPEEGGWPGGYESVRFGFEMPYAPELINRLNGLEASGRVRFVWVTSWMANAPELADRIGLNGQGWPVLDADFWEHLGWWKAEAIFNDQAENPNRFVWLDDDLYLHPLAQEWARNAGGHCLCPHPASGLLPGHVAFIEAMVGG